MRRRIANSLAVAGALTCPKLILVSLLLLCGSLALAKPPFAPPEKPAVLPEFRVPRENTLDENWLYVTTLYDASSALPELWGAVPVGFAKAPLGRAFIASLHTVFRTVDGGRSWTNLDPQPPPIPVSPYLSVRSPNFISDICWRPIRRVELNSDSLYLAVYNSAGETGMVRMMRGGGTTHVLWPDTLLLVDDWITAVAAPDSSICVALAGLDARIFRNDSMQAPTPWDDLPYEFTGSWVGELTTAGNFLYAAGSAFWLSLDRGFSWQTMASADPLGDTDIDFAPNSARALVSGGRTDPPVGWVRYTTDFGQTWSERTLNTDVPVRTVLFMDDTLGYAAGGSANDAIGRVWRTTDGGVTWDLELEVEAEITELGYARESGGYINIIAAGYFADFRCGVWRSHLQYPDSAGPVLVFAQDTLAFAAEPGATQTLQAVLTNIGDAAITVTDWLDSGPFIANCCGQDVILLPGADMTVDVTFAPGIAGEFTSSLRVQTDRSEYLALVAVGSALSSAEDAPLPQELALAVYPNPGNAEFRLSYSLARSSAVALTLFDVTGRAVATLVNARREAGEHVVAWNAQAEPSGVYFAVLTADNRREITKLVVLK